MFGIPRTPPAAQAADVDRQVDAAPSSPARFQQIGPAQRSKALARLLGQGRLAGDAQVRHFLHAAEDLGFSLEFMWGSRGNDGSFDAVMLIAPQPGRTGMVFISRPRGLNDVAPHGDLADFACRHTPPQEVGMAQALLALDQELERAALERGGFSRLATLTYMQRRTAPFPGDLASDEPIDWPANVRLLPYAEEHRPLFLAALEASYEQTLDCPALYGRRDLEDVLRGHMATGEFDADLWTLLMADDEPAGIMLLNRVPSAECVELVYLGLGLSYRGRGLAARLLRRALQLCRNKNESCLTLAVDEGNHPAKRLYQRFGFHRTTRKLALTRHLRPV